MITFIKLTEKKSICAVSAILSTRRYYIYYKTIEQYLIFRSKYNIGSMKIVKKLLVVFSAIFGTTSNREFVNCKPFNFIFILRKFYTCKCRIHNESLNFNIWKTKLKNALLSEKNDCYPKKKKKKKLNKIK